MKIAMEITIRERESEGEEETHMILKAFYIEPP